MYIDNEDFKTKELLETKRDISNAKRINDQCTKTHKHPKCVCIKQQNLKIYEAQSDNQKGEIRQIHTYSREFQHPSQQLIKLLSRK